MIKISTPNKSINTEIHISGSKSLSNRLLMVRAISGLDLHFKNLSDSDDTITMAKELGLVKGKTSSVIDVGHAGTDMRFLSAYLSGKIGDWTLTGSERMQQRPIGELVNTLRKLGANITYLNKEGFPPLKIVGSKLNGGAIEIDGSVSSQFITALLLIAPTLESGLTLQIKNESVSKPYIKMTIEVMNQFGVAVEQIGNVIKVPSAHYKKDGLDYYVESDWSSASYWYSFVALADEAKVTLRNFNKSSFQSDSIVQSLYEKLGVKTHWDATGITLTKQASSISELQYDFLDCPDIAQTVAATCVGLGLKAHLTGLQTLRIKETDRIAAMKAELERFGAAVEMTDSSIKINPNASPLTPTDEIKTYHDHRMAMSIAPLVMKCNTLTFDDEDVVNKSYAAFWDDLQEAGIDVE
ncbi:MAG: 3-phosphoshikimate 1-carboxyvinyltransferase [Bacteroidetes bacterium]|nr:3-phosphoshikimate 1-carboxyvinyltransferase [Bacteroidota bacterium]